jgi:hypothetical protein
VEAAAGESGIQVAVAVLAVTVLLMVLRVAAAGQRRLLLACLLTRHTLAQSELVGLEEITQMVFKVVYLPFIIKMPLAVDMVQELATETAVTGVRAEHQTIVVQRVQVLQTKVITVGQATVHLVM